jgi:hypothetical protein
MQAPKGQAARLQRRALSALCTPCSRPSRRLSGPPSSASSPSPYPYRVIGMVMIAFVGEVATFDKSGTGATSIFQSGGYGPLARCEDSARYEHLNVPKDAP